MLIRHASVEFASVVALVLTSAGFAGCLGTTSEESQDLPDESPVELRNPRLIHIINETAVPGSLEVWFRQSLDPDCQSRDGNGDYRNTPRWVYTVFDRYGLVEIRDKEIDPELSLIKEEIPLNGVAPFLVTVDPHFCHMPGSQYVNVTDGWYMRFEQGEHTAIDYFFNISVPQGKQTGVVTWTPSPYVFNIGWAIGGDEKTGNFWGTIRLVNPHGDVVVQERYDLSGLTGESFGYARVDGEYRIELELDQPAIQDTTWGYQIRVREEPPEVFCFLDFEWEECL